MKGECKNREERRQGEARREGRVKDRKGSMIEEDRTQ